MYQVNFNLKSAVSFIDRLFLDSLLSYAIAREYLGPAASIGKLTLTDEEVRFIHDRIPVKRHPDGYLSIMSGA